MNFVNFLICVLYINKTFVKTLVIMGEILPRIPIGKWDNKTALKMSKNKSYKFSKPWSYQFGRYYRKKNIFHCLYLFYIALPYLERDKN